MASLPLGRSQRWCNGREVMVKRIAVRVVSLCLLGAGGAFCQSSRPVDSGLPEPRVSGANSAAVESGTGAGRSLPDAPSAGIAAQADRFQGVGGDGRLAGKTGWVGPHARFIGGTELETVTGSRPAGFAFVYGAVAYQEVPAQKESSAFLGKYLYTSRSRQSLRYQASSSDSLMGRATDAASRIFVTTDESGRRRINTSYFVAVLTSVAVHNASRPYWARSNSAPLSDVGSTFGNDAGMNLLHEFGPGLRAAMTNHMPGFVSKIAGRFLDRSAREAASRPAR